MLHADRVEELSFSPFGLRVRRLFFDELASATVQRQFAPWTELAVALSSLLLGALLLGLTVWQRDWPVSLSASLGVAGVLSLCVFAGLALGAWLAPPHLLVLHAADQRLQGSLPRSAAAREERLSALLRAVESHQRLRPVRRAAEPEA